MELSQELKQRAEEAGRDAAWVKKLRAAATWEEYEKLLSEKGIEAPANLKETFAAAGAGKTGELADDELDKVSGGFGPILPCPGKYNYYLCYLSNCPHLEEWNNQCYCDVYEWTENI